jgi:hypothetical protein
MSARQAQSSEILISKVDCAENLGFFASHDIMTHCVTCHTDAGDNPTIIDAWDWDKITYEIIFPDRAGGVWSFDPTLPTANHA